MHHFCIGRFNFRSKHGRGAGAGPIRSHAVLNAVTVPPVTPPVLKLTHEASHMSLREEPLACRHLLK